MLLFVYILIPTESEASTFPLMVRTAVAMVLVGVALFSIREVRLGYSLVLVFVLFYFLVLSAISFSLRYFVASAAVVAAFFWALAYFQSSSFRNASVLALDLLIYVSMFFLVLQFMEYYLTGKLFDYHNLLFPWSEARLPLWSSLARVGGVYIEPGTYSNWIYTFLLLRLFMEKEVGSLMVPFVAITMIFSMSAWGVIIGVFVLAVYLVKGLDYKLAALIVAILGGFALGATLVDFGDVVHFLENRAFYSGSRNVRDDAVEEFLKILPDVLVFGLGFGRVFCVDCLSPQDAGVVISAVSVYGLIFSALFFSVIFYYAYLRGGVRFFLLCVPLLNTKLFYWDHILWMIFMFAVLGLVALRVRGGRGFQVEGAV